MATETGPLIVSYGGGINSTAMLVGMVERGIRPGAILFADTGGEHPRTYAYIEAVSAYCQAHGLPAITTVRHVYASGKYATLEDECLGSGTLPSIAYGWKKCSQKWKREPQERWAKTWQPAVDCWVVGGRVQKAIGYHAGETHRSVKGDDGLYTYRYLLREWGWYQRDCLAAVERAGLPSPHKSACFFCPASKAQEVRRMAVESPDLFRRALAIEDAARASGNLVTVKGLGRHWTWREVADADERQCKLFPDSTQTPCGCWDGADNEEDED